MYLNPLARLVMSFVLFFMLIIMIEDWITIQIRGLINYWRVKIKNDRGE